MSILSKTCFRPNLKRIEMLFTDHFVLSSFPYPLGHEVYSIGKVLPAYSNSFNLLTITLIAMFFKYFTHKYYAYQIWGQNLYPGDYESYNFEEAFLLYITMHCVLITSKEDFWKLVTFLKYWPPPPPPGLPLDPSRAGVLKLRHFIPNLKQSGMVVIKKLKMFILTVCTRKLKMFSITVSVEETDWKRKSQEHKWDIPETIHEQRQYGIIRPSIVLI
jgi:hypothetical protein